MKIKLNIPNSAEKLNDRQIRLISKAVFSSMKGKALILYFFLIISLIPFSLSKLIKTSIVLMNVPLSELQEFVQFLFDAKFYNFPKKIKSGHKKLYGPKPKLADISIDEFSFADLFFYQFSQNKNDIDALNRLVSSLYRFNKKKGNERMPFNKEKLPEISKYVEKIPLETKQAIAMCFAGTREYIANSYPFIFPKPKGNKKQPYVTFRKIIESMSRSENQPFGNFYQTKDANLYDFLSILQEEIKYQKEMERKYNLK